MYDILIIGSGIIGSSVARELSRFNSNTLVLEKANDVSCGTTKANSGIVHAGFDAVPGTEKAKYNVLGAKMYPELAKELDFPFKKNGALVLSFSEEGHDTLLNLLDRAHKNGVEGCEIISGDEIRKLEPNVSKEVVEGLYAKESGIVSPYEMCIAMAENAASNGVKFEFLKEVSKVEKLSNGFKVLTKDGSVYETKVLVNAAGVHSDEINNMLSNKKYNINARKGEYVLLDKEFSYIAERTLFQLPTKMGKGILVSPTTHGNIIVGPTALDVDDKDKTWTTPSGLNEAWSKALLSVPSLPRGGIITQFSGLRAHSDNDDFVVGFSEDVEGLYNLVGIESPGLASSPAIARHAALEIAKYLNLKANANFNPKREGIKHISHMNDEELAKAIKENPLYGHVICRCEVVSEAEIREAIRRVPGAKDLDGVKRRVRAGMGRCQMGFCTPRIMEILAEELGETLLDVSKRGTGSELVVGRIKE
ncbi:MAG: NAD(P)/FAD-dependent oxidoreductase [Gammaproteobacteria bacterium]|nr:NAD(P)/FAD-dependent oxidoreductase [Gammaproteobacteria bacterium]